MKYLIAALAPYKISALVRSFVEEPASCTWFVPIDQGGCQGWELQGQQGARCLLALPSCSAP